MYNYEIISNEAKAVITEQEWNATINRIIKTLDHFADHGADNWNDIEWSPDAISKNLISWANGKWEIISKIKAHPSYNASEPFKIIHDVTAERILNRDTIYDYADSFGNRSNCNYYFETFVHWVINQCNDTFLTDEFCKRYVERRGEYADSAFCKDLRACKLLAPNVPYSEEVYDKLLKVNPHAGQKTNKFVRKLITAIVGSVDEREFAKYSDALNPTVFKRKAVFSVDPVDYILMSHGNSWASCYWINKDDPGSYEGCYSNGTWSYMADNSTILMYIVADGVETNFAWSPKVYRQCTMWNGEDMIISSRIYPSNENDDKIRKEFRGYAQQFISELYDLGNNWEAKELLWDRDYGKKIFDSHDFELNNEILNNSSNFVGYTDPFYFTQSVSLNKAAFSASEKTAPKKIVYGAKAYCPVCGKAWYGGDGERYVCGDCDEENHRGQVQCECCGDWYDEDDDRIHWCEDVGEYRCEDCSSYCDYHERWEAVRDYDMYTVYRSRWGGTTTENWCYDAMSWEATCCDECGEYWHSDDVEEVDGYYLCPDCRESKCAECEECGELHLERNLHEYTDPETGEVLMLCDDCYEARIEADKEREQENEILEEPDDSELIEDEVTKEVV